MYILIPKESNFNVGYIRYYETEEDLKSYLKTARIKDYSLFIATELDVDLTIKTKEESK